LKTKTENLENAKEDIALKLENFKHSDISRGKNNSPSQIERAAKTPSVANQAMLPIVASQNQLAQRHQTIP
jgi:hypothetical protein